MNHTSSRSGNISFLTLAAIIAALYVVLTFFANMLGLASGSIQIRFSEALAILPYFTPAAVPGLTIGCFLANLLTGCALPDLIFGPIATLIGAFGTRLLRNKSKWLAPLPPIAANAVILPIVLFYGYGIRPVWFSFITVTLGEIISCGVLGIILLDTLEKYRNQLFPEN